MRRFLGWTLLWMGCSSVLAAPVFTGRADLDFDLEVQGTWQFEDGIGDVGIPTYLPDGTISGMDIANIFAHYDPVDDIFYVGIDTERIGGDVDGDGDPSSASQVLLDEGGQDNPDFGNTESFCLIFDTDLDGTLDIVAGKPARSDSFIWDYTVATFNGTYPYPLYPQLGFLDDLPEHQGVIYGSPTAEAPHVEFTITNFSTLPGFPQGLDPLRDPIEFGFSAYMGSDEDVGISEDFFPVQGDVVHILLPPPTGSVTGLVFEDQDGNGIQEGGELGTSGITVELEGDFDGDGSYETIETSTGGGGTFLFEDLPEGTYLIRILAPFGYELTTMSFHEFDLDPAQDYQTPDFGVMRSDTDGDGIPDVIEGEQNDEDGDGIPDYQDTDADGDGLGDGMEAGVDPANPVDSDGDGEPDYLDMDSDDDGLTDDLEGGIDLDGDGLLDDLDDTDGDGLPDVLDPDSDDDGIKDGTEAGVTSSTANPDTNTSSANFESDADPSTSTDPDDVDSDDDCIADGVEDSDGNGAAEGGETDPSNPDSDGDGVQDGTELGYTDGTNNTNMGVCVPDADAGQTTTEPTLADTDGGGKEDGAEDVNGNGQVDEGELDPNYGPDDTDADGDGLLDTVEVQVGTDPLNPDTDGDGIPDGVDGIEDVDGDGDVNAADTDSDGDGLSDAEEGIDPETGTLDPVDPYDNDGDGTPDYVDVDSDDDGVLDADEPAGDHDGDGLPAYQDPDSDNDGLYDGTESGVTEPTAGTNVDSSFYVPDSNPDSTTDPQDADTDDDGLLDGNEDENHDGSVNGGETNPNDEDTDNDCLQDGTELGLTEPETPAEPATNAGDTDLEVFIPDDDPDTTTNPLNDDTDGGGASDGLEDRNCDGSMDLGEGDPNDASDDGLVDSDGDGLSDQAEQELGTDPNDADSDDDGLLDGAEAIQDSDGDGLIDPLDNDSDNDGLQDGTEVGLTADDVSEDTDMDIFVPDSDPATTTDPTDSDSDDDGLSDGEEDSNGNGALDEGETDAGDADTDGDGIQDGTEKGLVEGDADSDTDLELFEPDADPSTTTDPLDFDTDDDGLADGDEDSNQDGALGDGESDPGAIDTDGDGIQDGTESGVTSEDVTEDTDLAVFVPDSDSQQRTDPADGDSDDDGLLDGEEDMNSDGQVDEGETDPGSSDTDGDGLQDGTEVGLVEADVDDDTDLAIFVPDANPDSVTDPLDDDTDDDGLLDGAEDVNLNGQKDEGETDPNDGDSDGDCILDGTELGLTEPDGSDTNPSVFVPDTEPSTTTDPLVADVTACDGSSATETPTPGLEETPTPTPDEDAAEPEIEVLGGGGCQGCATAQGPGTGSTWTLLLFGLALFGLRRRRFAARALMLAMGLIAAVAYVPQAVAQDVSTAPAIEVQQFHPGVDLSGNIMTSGTATLRPSDYSMGIWLDYSDDPLVVLYDGVEADRLQAGVTGVNLVGAVGLLERVQLTASVPLTIYQWVSTDNELSSSPSNIAMNDASLGLRWTLKERVSEGLGVAIAPRVWLPTGSPSSYTGGQFSAGAALLADARVGEGWFGLNLGYRVRQEPQILGNLVVDDELYFSLGAARRVGDYYLMVDLFGKKGVTTANDGVSSDPLELMLGLSRPFTSGPTLTLGASTGLVAGYGAPDFRILAGVSFGQPRASDRDGDGIYDHVDQCRDEPEDYDSFEDTDGCPDPDNDQDGVADLEDRCPMDPEDRDLFQDEDGCPEPDNDDDGLLDTEDQCPRDPEDVDGYQDGDGCPDTDNDGDGMPDATDQCPNEAEDFDTFEDDDGCPDSDNDQDGILDQHDQCPINPETINDFEDEDGCPDVRITVEDVQVEEGRLILLDRIYFDFDSNTIAPESFAILKSAADVFRENPDLRVRIEGHTDAEGSEDYNLELSTQRAAAVKTYMVEKEGLEAGQLESAGLGESMPIDTNDTEAGRARNRRIEWVILP